MYPGTFIAGVVQLSVSCKAWKQGKVVQNVVFVSQVVQPLTAPITFFTIQVYRGQEPRYRLSRGWDTRRHASSKRVCKRSTSIPGTKLLNLSRFNTQFAPIVMEAICANTGNLSRSALFTETRIPVETHLMSNISFVRPALSRIVHRKIACALFQRLLSGAVSSVALKVSPLIRIGVQTSACWRSVVHVE